MIFFQIEHKKVFDGNPKVTSCSYFMSKNFLLLKSSLKPSEHHLTYWVEHNIKSKTCFVCLNCWILLIWVKSWSKAAAESCIKTKQRTTKHDSHTFTYTTEKPAEFTAIDCVSKSLQCMWSTLLRACVCVCVFKLFECSGGRPSLHHLIVTSRTNTESVDLCRSIPSQKADQSQCRHRVGVFMFICYPGKDTFFIAILKAPNTAVGHEIMEGVIYSDTFSSVSAGSNIL